MNKALIVLSLGFLLSPYEGQATHPEYVLTCAKLLEDLQASPVVVPPFYGRVATKAEISASKDLALWTRDRKGRLTRLDDAALGHRDASKVFRWAPEAGETEVIKTYYSEADANKSDRQFKLISHNLPTGLLEVIPQLGKFGALRFYKNIEGVTIEHLIRNEYYSNAVNFEIIRLYTKQLNLLRDKIVERYGAENVKEVEEDWGMIVPDLHLEIKTPDQGSVGIWIHDTNVLFDSKTKTFWIIDPE